MVASISISSFERIVAATLQSGRAVALSSAELVGKINHADTDDIDEPAGWFGSEINAGGLSSPALTLNQGPESHDAARFSPIVDAGNSLTRFELIEGGAVDWASHDRQLGRMIEEQRDFDEAVETFERALEIAPASVANRIGLAD